MNTKTTLLVAGLALAALPAALAGDAGTKFKQMDTNGDGRITREEHVASALAIFDKQDTNRDGIVTAAELFASQEKKKSGWLKFWEKDKDKDETPPLSPTGKLSQADQNSDGQITRAEQEADAGTVFTAWDTDKDGFLTDKELEAGLGNKPATEDK